MILTHDLTTRDEDAAGAAAPAGAAPAVVVAVAVVVVPVVVAASVDLAAPVGLVVPLVGALLPPQPLPRRPLLTRPSWQDSRHNAPQDNKNHEELFPQS